MTWQTWTVTFLKNAEWLLFAGALVPAFGGSPAQP
jgi:hypothetical protein